jgi:hypothetical protein
MAENQLPIVGGRDVPQQEGLGSLQNLVSKADKGVRSALGPASGPLEGLLSLFDLRNVPQALETAGQDLETGATEGDPRALLAGILGTALIGAEGMPQGRPVNRIARRKSVPNFNTASEKEFYEKLKKDLPSLFEDKMPSGPIKITSQKKNKEGFLLDEDDNPVVVYHSTKSREPFSEFNLKKGRYDFLSTATQPNVASDFGLAGLEEEGARLIPGMVKAKKTFDFENVKDTEDILNKFSKTAKKDIKELDDVLSKLKTTNKSSLKIRDYIDPNLLTNDQKQMVIFLHTQNGIPMPKAISQYLELNKEKLTEKLSDIFKNGIKKGRYDEIEDKDFLKVLKQEGYDSFTTSEKGGKNVMLFEPDKQFIPLYDTEKTSKIGYQKGGSIVERNPYNYKPRAI